MRAHWKYLQYVIRHKYFVFLACLQYRLIWRGIKHDWTKFLPSEWSPYVHYFYGDHRPDVSNSKVGYNHQLHFDDTEFNYAWNYHQKRNSHHWQYYVLAFDDGGVQCLKMPNADMKEMLADWRGAGKAQGRPNTWEWYEVNKDKMQLHAETRAWIETELEQQQYTYEREERLRSLGVIT